MPLCAPPPSLPPVLAFSSTPTEAAAAAPSWLPTTPRRTIQRIQLTVQYQQGCQVHFIIGKSKPLGKLMDVYCSRLGLQASQVRFAVNGTSIARVDTADKLKLSDMDLIDVELLSGSSCRTSCSSSSRSSTPMAGDADFSARPSVPPSPELSPALRPGTLDQEALLVAAGGSPRKDAVGPQPLRAVSCSDPFFPLLLRWWIRPGPPTALMLQACLLGESHSSDSGSDSDAASNSPLPVSLLALCRRTAEIEWNDMRFADALCIQPRSGAPGGGPVWPESLNVFNAQGVVQLLSDVCNKSTRTRHP